MTSNNAIDADRVELLLSELRLPAIKLMWAALAARADKEGWPAARFLAALAEHEMADRGRRRIERHLASARLPAGKTFDTFDFNAVPMISKAQVMALAAGDGWLDQGANIRLCTPPPRRRANEQATRARWTTPQGKRQPRRIRPGGCFSPVLYGNSELPRPAADHVRADRALLSALQGSRKGEVGDDRQLAGRRRGRTARL
jgi:hypothetical protein